jgi:PAS domain S-box-containing protein
MRWGRIAKTISRFVIYVLAVLAVTAANYAVPVRDRTLTASLAFLFVILIVSSTWGFRYALFVSLLAALGFSWLLPPVGHFWLSDSRDVFTLAAFLVIGITSSHFSDRARREALNARRAEDAARQSEKQFPDLIETIPTMVFSIGPDGSNEFASRNWQDYTGLSLEKTAGSGWQATVHSGDLDTHLNKWRASLATGQPFENEVRRRGANGEYGWFLVRGVPLRDPHGEILNRYGTLTDIEDRKQAEQPLRKSEERWRSVFENSAIGVALTDLD